MIADMFTLFPSSPPPPSIPSNISPRKVWVLWLLLLMSWGWHSFMATAPARLSYTPTTVQLRRGYYHWAGVCPIMWWPQWLLGQVMQWLLVLVVVTARLYWADLCSAHQLWNELNCGSSEFPVFATRLPSSNTGHNTEGWQDLSHDCFISCFPHAFPV